MPSLPDGHSATALPGTGFQKRSVSGARSVFRKLVSGAAALAVGSLTALTLPLVAAAPASAATTDGCSYGEGGPSANALCWIDFAAFGSISAEELSSGSVSKPLSLTVGRYQFDMTAVVSAGTDGSQGVQATALPTWPGSVLGTTKAGEDFYLGTTGKPALYQATDSHSGDNMLRDTIELKNITVLDTQTNLPVTSGYALVMADAESTGAGEGFSWSSSSNLSEYTRAVPNGGNQPCTGALTGIGTTTVDCTGGPRDLPNGDRGILMVSADSPTWISSQFRNNYASSREGVAFAVVLSTSTSGINVAQDGGSDAEFTVNAKNPSGELGKATSDGGENIDSPYQFLSSTEEVPTDYTVSKTGGNTPAGAYDITWECSVNGVSVTPTLSEDGLTATVNAPPNGASKCVATSTAKAPKADPDTKTINPNQTATLTPEVTKGNGAITKVTFDDGSAEKVVPGEGTWTIELVDGKPQAKFTPEQDYTGPVTQQKYTITDEFGLTAESTLDVNINQPPAAEPDAKTVDQGETATLNPETTAGTGDLTDVAFDNGETSKVVEGEGTWSIELKDGKVVATFTPEEGFTGPVTQQKYTVTDSNNLTASSTLDVTIRPVADPDKVIVDQGETATLNPTTTPGSAPLEQAAFDNGQTTKVVEGEGTWNIELKDGKVVATFTPEDGFTGPVTQQNYTVTDENGEKASSTLDVTIRPAAGDDEKTINPNTTATLNPDVTPGSGDIEKVTFDDGTTEKVVPGEGTWTIELVEGKPVSTFTPEKDYDGPVTPQKYTVTDSNGETATGELKVNINQPPKAGDQAKVIKPNETATLTPTVTPGNSPIVSAVFDNGETEKVVPGEGTWKLELKDGKVTSTFTPEKDYDGPVTQQPYTVTDENGLSASGKLDVTIIHTGILIDKDYTIVDDANNNGKNDPGDLVKWTFKVTNTGNIDLSDVKVNDPKLDRLGVGIACPSDELEAKADMMCESANYTITKADAAAGTIVNIATASGNVPPNTPGDPENPGSPPDRVEIPTEPTPGTPGTPDSPKEPLAHTGGQMMWPLAGVGAVALLAGGALMLARFRRHEEETI